MQPIEFVKTYKSADLSERSLAQSHFNDLCALLGEEAPVRADPSGDWFTFEKGVGKTTGGRGWADVWRRGCFAWEYKGKKKNLDAAFAQLQQYAVALENPPLLIVSDIEQIRIHTNWTNTVTKRHDIALDDLINAEKRDLLKWAFQDPDKLKPDKTRQRLTEDAARSFAGLALRLRERGYESEAVAHFINRLVFCMFAEDVGLLPNRMFQRLLEACAGEPDQFAAHASSLFEAMRVGGHVGFEKVEWFNGGLFDSEDVLPLDSDDIRSVLEAARFDWSDIEPSVFGTLFERGLDPDKRSQLGAHFTNGEKIFQIVEPVIARPLLTEWEVEKKKIAAEIARAPKATTSRSLSHQRKSSATRSWSRAERLKAKFLERLKNYRILDPACGSGNFLHIALLILKDIEHKVNLDCEELGLERGFPLVGPESMLGLEINPFAAELARVSVWMGEIQWMRRHGFEAKLDPVLRSLSTIECRDALITKNGDRAEWPNADVVVGNPPFLGGKRLRDELGDGYVDELFAAWRGRVRAECDLVLYWFAKSGEMIRDGRLSRAGLVSTNSIRGGANRATFEQTLKDGRIFEAWGDEPWVVDGADVRVSLICFDDGKVREVHFDGEPVTEVFSDLTPVRHGSSQVDLTKAIRLKQNAGVAFMGDTKGGAFDIPGDLAREWLKLPLNPNGRPNSDVLRPWANGMDVTRRSSGKWIIDFGWEMSEADAALYEAPFAHVLEHVKPVREKNNRELYRRVWWRHAEPRPGMHHASENSARWLVTPEVSKHRVFSSLPIEVLPDHKLQTFVKCDDAFFGILLSRAHKVWSLRVGSWHGVGNDPRYTISTCFLTFPFPEGLTPDIPPREYTNPFSGAVASSARELHSLREKWLNPKDLITLTPEVVPGFPKRRLPIDKSAEKELKKRTLTNLYNSSPKWLENAHRDLDQAVASAYGWSDDWAGSKLNDNELVKRLFQLNRKRAALD